VIAIRRAYEFKLLKALKFFPLFEETDFLSDFLKKKTANTEIIAARNAVVRELIIDVFASPVMYANEIPVIRPIVIAAIGEIAMQTIVNFKPGANAPEIHFEKSTAPKMMIR
jgi:hypothetical protein